MKNVGDGRRVARVEREVQATVAQFLIRGLKSEIPGIVTVTQVRMPADLRAAKVYVSVLGSEEQVKRSVDVLEKRAFEIQNYISKELKLRYCPKLTFFLDGSVDNVIKVDRILHQLEQERQATKGEIAGQKSDESADQDADENVDESSDETLDKDNSGDDE